MKTNEVNYRVDAVFPKLNKNSSLDEYREHAPEYGVERCRAQVNELVKLSDAEWNEFVNNLLEDRDWLDGKGGNGSDYNPKYDISAREGYIKLMNDEDERSAWIKGSYRICVEVVNMKTYKSVLVDPQGYKYARYVGWNAADWDAMEPPQKETPRPVLRLVPDMPEPVCPEPSGKGILVDNIKARDFTSFGTKHKGDTAIGHHAEVHPKKSIRLFGVETNLVNGPLAYDKVYKVGDFATYDSYNLTYIGTVVAIGKKTVSILPEHTSSGQVKRLDLYTFSRRNRRFDVDKAREANNEASYYI